MVIINITKLTIFIFNILLFSLKHLTIINRPIINFKILLI